VGYGNLCTQTAEHGPVLGSSRGLVCDGPRPVNIVRGMRVRMLLCAAVATAVIPAADSLPAFGSASVGVRCLTVTWSASRIESRPRTCALHRAGTPLGSPTVLQFSSLRWSSWGEASVHGTGIGDFGMGHFPRVAMTLFRPVSCGSRRVYSRMSYRLRSGGKTSKLKIAACRR
jgi:hypothetical protein